MKLGEFINENRQTYPLCFLDDAGDPGFKFDRGSTRYFVIGCVITDAHMYRDIIKTHIEDIWKFE
jgi:hypothetical protein